jgi:hypothetical protein
MTRYTLIRLAFLFGTDKIQSPPEGTYKEETSITVQLPEERNNIGSIEFGFFCPEETSDSQEYFYLTAMRVVDREDTTIC